MKKYAKKNMRKNVGALRDANSRYVDWQTIVLTITLRNPLQVRKTISYIKQIVYR